MNIVYQMYCLTCNENEDEQAGAELGQAQPQLGLEVKIGG